MADIKSQGPTVIFQIGFHLCKSNTLSTVLEKNGYIARNFVEGRLAENIAYCQVTGEQPLLEFPRANMFGRLEGPIRLFRPKISGFLEFRFLAQKFPSSLFVFQKRDAERSIPKIVNGMQTSEKIARAKQHNVHEDGLCSIIQKEYLDHYADSKTFFQGSSNFFEFDLDKPDTPALCNWLKQNGYQIEKTLENSRKTSQNDNIRQKPMSQYRVPNSPPVPLFSSSEFTSLVDFCIGDVSSHRSGQDPKFSEIFARRIDRDTIVNRRGQRMPIVMSKTHDNRPIFKGKLPKFQRTMGVLDDIALIKRCDLVSLDMQDARRFGVAGKRTPQRPTLVYNRRIGAKNLPLWPLPGYHSIGAQNFVSTHVNDVIPFDEKRDVCVWRGMLSGQAHPFLNANLTQYRSSHVLMQELAKVKNDPVRLEMLQAELRALPRYKVVETFMHDERFDLGFVIPEAFKEASESILLRFFCASLRDRTWFHQHKYILSISGHDTGSNFLSAAQSNSVILKEDDGWEVFYSNLFRPWEHFIPFDLGGENLMERLEWARSNQSECQKISKRAQLQCLKLTHPKSRTDLLNCILDSIVGYD